MVLSTIELSTSLSSSAPQSCFAVESTSTCLEKMTATTRPYVFYLRPNPFANDQRVFLEVHVLLVAWQCLDPHCFLPQITYELHHLWENLEKNPHLFIYLIVLAVCQLHTLRKQTLWQVRRVVSVRHSKHILPTVTSCLWLQFGNISCEGENVNPVSYFYQRGFHILLCCSFVSSICSVVKESVSCRSCCLQEDVLQAW